MVALLDVPPELLSRIVEYVAWNGTEYNTAGLASLTITCRTFYQLSNRLLYRRFSQKSSQGYKLGRTIRFLMTILNRPALAASVEDLFLTPYVDCKDNHGGGIEEAEGIESNNKEETEIIEGTNIDPLITLIETLPWSTASGKEMWCNAVRLNKDLDVLCAILLFSTPNLKRLTVTIDCAFCPHGGHSWFQAAIYEGSHQGADFAGMHLFGSLAEVIYSATSFNSNVDIRSIENFFYVPSLREFTVDQLYAPYVDWDKVLSGLFATENLTLLRSKIYAWENLLKPMKRLKKLVYTVKPREAPRNSGLQASQIGVALLFVKEELESLALMDFQFACPSYQRSLLGSLSEFPKLRELEIQLALLIGCLEHRVETRMLWELLPRSLENLSLVIEHAVNNNREDWLGHVIGVVLKKPSSFPRLEKLHLVRVSEDSHALQAACTANNVAYSSLLWP